MSITSTDFMQLGNVRREINVPRTDWLVWTNSALMAPKLKAMLDDAEKRGTVTIDESGHPVKITFQPKSEL